MNKKERKIYVVGGDVTYANWMEGTIVDTMEQADLVVFTGGEDVSPSLYSHPIHPMTQCNRNRDDFEIDEYNKARELKKKLIGICRGAQFLCVMAGGTLVQHQQNPSYIHSMETCSPKYTVVRTTSSHHQAQNPGIILGHFYKILAWTNNMCGKRYDGFGNEVLQGREIEVVVYHNIDALAIQGHPEWMYGDTQYKIAMEYYNALLDDHMNTML